MATVNVITKVRIGRKNFIIRSNDPILDIITESMIEGTKHQIKLMAYGARDLLIDKLLAYSPAFGRPILYREPGVGGVPDPILVQGYDRKTETTKILERKKLLPKRSLKKPEIKRIPFEGMKALSKKYQEHKVKQGKDPRMLMSGGDYLRGIVVRKEKLRNEEALVVMMAKRDHTSGIPLDRLAKIIEYGTGAYTIFMFGDKTRPYIISLPPRPHWGPAFVEIKKVSKELGYKVRAKELRDRLSKIK